MTSELLNLLLVKLQPLSCKCSLKHLAFHLLSSFENSAIPWLVTHLAYVNVDKVTRNYMCFRKQNFHGILVDSVACHAVTVFKICKSTCSHTIISHKTLFVTKSNIFTSTLVIKFSISQFHIIYFYVTFHTPCSFENMAQWLCELYNWLLCKSSWCHQKLCLLKQHFNTWSFQH